MNARDLPEKWEREAKELRKESAKDKDINTVLDKKLVADINDLRAAELRAALPEQPLSKQWREQGEKFHQQGMDTSDDKMQFAFWSMADLCEEHAGDLDSQRDRDREFMQTLEERLRARYVGATEDIDSVLVEFADEIRNHLEEPSDEA